MCGGVGCIGLHVGLPFSSDVSNEEPSVMRYILKVKSIEGQ